MQDFIEANGAAHRYELSGSGEKVLVLVHELAGSLNSWDALLPLLPAGWRVLRYDLRGSGMSEKVQGRLDLDALADDVAALMDALGLSGPAVVAGAAVGSTVAVRFATRHAARCKALALIGPALAIPAERKPIARDLCDRIDREGLRPVAEAVLPKAFPENLWSDATAKRRAIARWLGADPQGYAAAYRMLVEIDLSADLAALSLPVLVLAGEHDPFGTPEIVERLTATIPTREYSVAAGGHFMAVQSPAILAEALKPFLARF